MLCSFFHSLMHLFAKQHQKRIDVMDFLCILIISRDIIFHPKSSQQLLFSH